jgi:hypothetical protein
MDAGSAHEARNVLFDNDTRLLIATTFDGDWDKYIDDFSRTHSLDAWDAFLVQCEGYPDGGKSVLSLDGMKEYLIANTVTADVYVRAYTHIVKEIWKADRVNKAFQKVLDNPAAAQALAHPALKPLLDLAAD